MEKVNLSDKFALFTDHWHPRIVGELNGQQVKLVKFRGDFLWHRHEGEDELFLVFEPAGTLNTGDAVSDRTVPEPERI